MLGLPSEVNYNSERSGMILFFFFLTFVLNPCLKSAKIKTMDIRLVDGQLGGLLLRLEEIVALVLRWTL